MDVCAFVNVRFWRMQVFKEVSVPDQHGIYSHSKQIEYNSSDWRQNYHPL